ncbi:hypothetical protein NFI96_028042 [Prochilodus magdalenae]|nr:hypothetical protein NFI96_028042 [Prochilodus magdalenae]
MPYGNVADRQHSRYQPGRSRFRHRESGQGRQTERQKQRKLSPGTKAALRNCFESPEWSVLQEPYGEDIEGITHCMTDYMNFCMDVVPVKTVRCFANKQPWLTSSVKGLLNKKKRAFKDNNQEELRSAERELKVHLREAKESYRRKVEQKGE